MFKIDGVKSTELGVIAVEEDFLSRAPIRYEEIIIDGNDIPVVNELGYSNVVGQLQLQTRKSSLDEIFSIFLGKRTFEYQDRITFIEFYDMVEAKRSGSHKFLTVNYRRHPFWFKLYDDFIVVDRVVKNEGNLISLPIIELTGSGKTDIAINNVRFIYNFDDTGKVLIDCAQKTEMWDGLSKSKNIEIGFDYPSLKVGDNTIIVHSGNPTIRMKRKDRWL